MQIPSPEILIHGAGHAPAERRVLRAGPVTLVQENGDLRDIRLGDREVIRRIYGAVRDGNWSTVPGVISDLEVHADEDSFAMRFVSEHRRGDIDFIWSGEAHGGPDGTIRYFFRGEARSSFLRNRIGICVLHPAGEAAGARCRAIYTGGAACDLVLPRTIAREQPIRGVHDLAGFEHEALPGIWCALEFEGDEFEMEDQRNWIDASFKIFSTPLRIPYPLEIPEGHEVTQKVELHLLDQDGDPLSAREVEGRAGPVPSADEPVEVALAAAPSRPLPAIGLGVASHGEPLLASEIERLRILRPAHLRVDLHLADGAWEPRLRQAESEAAAIGCALEIAAHASADEPSRGMAALCEAIATAAAPVARVLVLTAGAPSTSPAAIAAARERLVAPVLAVGTDGDLFRIHLERPNAAGADAICWSMNPQCHAFDNASIAETPEGAAAQVASVREHYPGKRLVVSPVTLRPRFGPAPADSPDDRPAVEPPPQVDTRQMSLFGAAWTLAMIKRLAESGADAVTFYETSGWRGVLERAGGAALPHAFPSIAGGVYPLFHVLADVCALDGGDVAPCVSTGAPGVEALIVRRDGRSVCLLANLSPRPRVARLAATAARARARKLDAVSVVQAMADPERWRAGAGDELHARRGFFDVVLEAGAVARVVEED